MHSRNLGQQETISRVFVRVGNSVATRASFATGREAMHDENILHSAHFLFEPDIATRAEI